MTHLITLGGAPDLSRTSLMVPRSLPNFPDCPMNRLRTLGGSLTRPGPPRGFHDQSRTSARVPLPLPDLP